MLQIFCIDKQKTTIQSNFYSIERPHGTSSISVSELPLVRLGEGKWGQNEIILYECVDRERVGGQDGKTD